MTKEKLNHQLKGQLRIVLTNKAGQVVKDTGFFDNAIIANGPIILARLLGGSGYHLNRISAIEANAVIFTAENLDVTYPNFNEVLFTALFQAEDFDSHIDELQLLSSIGGTFSRVTGLDITKDSGTNMGVQWKINTSFCIGLEIPGEEEAIFPQRANVLENGTIYTEDDKTFLQGHTYD